MEASANEKLYNFIFFTAACVDALSNIMLEGSMDGVYVSEVVNGLISVAYIGVTLISLIKHKGKTAVSG